MGAPVELFVYWKLSREQVGAAHAALAAAQRGLMQQHPQLTAEAFRRADDAGGVATLMETYAAPGGIDMALRHEIDAAVTPAVAAWLTGPRHVEVFERLQPPG